ncbi:dihydrodipicolinate synthase family protein [Algisphaera agarilytica]|uniref:4-hydroxy-tetrahydrodipicolinate synthase n=1 Tax=Algisphaera agarilytica TaxID=1385975 RepID=A0A7X0H5A4_9BACT|nr:dihydrodipicolinate synthase family protein [Algisphaera agarilytica]MBB6429552.1 4-hydroxy-tetrahydrodipicolinate synthase [Algisphaera agarilytica]
MAETLQGILPVLPTPFDADGGIDLPAMPRLVRFALDAGVHGVVFPGFASEVEHLTADERLALLKSVVDAVGGAVPIVAGASGPDVESVVEHGRAAAELGIPWLMIQPPKSIGSEAAEVVRFMTEVADGLTDSRFVLQNAPAPRGSDLSAATLRELAAAVPQIAYIKEETLPSGPSISALLDEPPVSLRGVIGGGGARYILDEYQRGACAVMPALELADEHVALDRAWRSGDRATARSIYVRTLPLLVLQAVYRMRLTKHTLVRRGVLEHTTVRAPTPEMDAAAVADVDANLAELGLVPAAPA